LIALYAGIIGLLVYVSEKRKIGNQDNPQYHHQRINTKPSTIPIMNSKQIPMFFI